MHLRWRISEESECQRDVNGSLMAVVEGCRQRCGLGVWTGVTRGSGVKRSAPHMPRPPQHMPHLIEHVLVDGPEAFLLLRVHIWMQENIDPLPMI